MELSSATESDPLPLDTDRTIKHKSDLKLAHEGGGKFRKKDTAEMLEKAEETFFEVEERLVAEEEVKSGKDLDQHKKKKIGLFGRLLSMCCLSTED